MVGAVIHVYNLQTALAALPAGGIVDALPLSWYFPKSPRYQLYTTAIVYRRMREATGARGIGARRAARATTTRG